MFTRQGLRLAWRETRPYFAISIVLFFAGLVVGVTTEGRIGFLDQQLSGIKSISDSIRDSDNPELTGFVLIVLNNLRASLLVMGLGVIAGIMPVFALVSNGLVVGYVLARLSADGGNVWLLVVKGLLPHAVFELTAVFLASAFGIRFGMTLIKGIIGSVSGTAKTDPWQPFVRTATGAVPAVIVVIALLVFAAVVESTFTSWLVST